MAVNNQPRSFQQWAAIGATPNDFNLDSGIYALTLHATAWTGGAQLKQLQPDGSYIAVSNSVNADGQIILQLSAGQYQLTLTTVTGLTGNIALIARGGLRG